MKKILYGLMAMFAILVISCKDEEEDPVSDAPGIIAPTGTTVMVSEVVTMNFGISAPTWGGDPTFASYDVNEDNAVGGPDLSQTFQRFGSAPGPTSRTCADCTAPPASGYCP